MPPVKHPGWLWLLLMTVVYLLIVLYFVFWAAYLVDYLPQSDEAVATFQERLTEVLGICVVPSVIGYIPVASLTGIHPK